MQKVSYASLGSLGEDFHQAYDSVLKHTADRLGRAYPLFINGQQKKAKIGTFNDVCPADVRKILGKFQHAGREETRLAIAGAKAAYPEWVELGWPQRLAFVRKAADLLSERQPRLAVMLSLDVGKNRLEAIAEAAETIELIRYYCDEMERNNGYEIPLSVSGLERTRSVLCPYGVWAVIAPFNFPLALAAGMTTAALIAGNTVVFKPASHAAWVSLALYEALHDAGLPIGVFNYLTGPGQEIGEELITNPDVAGLSFTGSRDVGLQILRRFQQDHYPRPCLVEMGGKNPAIIMSSANLDDASEGVLRSAFGLSGQKCSACSRVYLHRNVYAKFLDLLVNKTKACRVGYPWDRDTAIGPLISEIALQKYQRAVRLAQKEGRIVHGGHRLARGEWAHGFFVEPTIVDRLPRTSSLFQDELFSPVLALAEFKSLEEAVALANSTAYGLTAGIFTESESEQEYFFEHIHAGAAFANRTGGATTGAWPGIQSFGGWKASSGIGKNALGPYYVPQFLREQSQTIVKKPISPPFPLPITRLPALAMA